MLNTSYFYITKNISIFKYHYSSSNFYQTWSFMFFNVKKIQFMKILKITFCLLLFTNLSYGQLSTTIDFETANSGYTPSTTSGSSNSDTFNRVSAGVNGNSTFYWVAEDISGNPYINLNQIEISGSSSFTFSIDLSYPNSEKWDSTDELLITYSIDNGDYENLIWVQHINSDAYNNPAALDLDFDSHGDVGQELSTSSFETYTTLPITLNSNSTLDIKLQFNNLTSNGEGIFIDNILITETSDNGNSAPQINNTSYSPTYPTSSDAVVISADISDTDGIASANLNWGTSSGNLTNTVVMSNTNGNTYQGSIDPQIDGTTVFYEIEATDTNASPTTTTNPEQNYSVVDPIDNSIPYSIDFTSNDPSLNSWTIQNITGSSLTWSYTNGAGVQMNAYSENCNAEDWLISPSFNLDISSGEELSYNFSQRYGSQAIEIYYSTDYSGTGDPNIANWNLIESVAAETSSGSPVNISRANVNNLQAVSGTAVYIAFKYSSTASDCSDWTLKNFSISETATWTGTTDNDYHNASNWSSNILPDENYDIIIPSDAVIGFTQNITFNSMTVASGASIISQSNATITGPITYTRTIPTTNWYLISSPVSGQDIDTFVSNSNLATGIVIPENLGFADYDNSSEEWFYYQDGTIGTGNFTTGQGHAVKLAAAGNVSFTGSFHDSNVDIALSMGFNGFNLIGNPYLSSVSVSELLNENSALLDELTIWLWDQVADAYVQKNLLEDLEIAPGQGFFVLANTPGTFTITEAMQSHSSDTFQRPSSRTEISIEISNGTHTRVANIFYIDGATTGWDNGYDSSIFEGLTNEFSIYTRAVDNGSERNLGIQSLPYDDFENMIIPVGVNAESGTSIYIDATTNNLPIGMNVYLEDKQDNSFTLLESDSSYTTTLESDQVGIGRFYLHTTTSSLSIDDLGLNKNVRIYPSSRENLHIVGVQNGPATIQLYNILGKEVLHTSFEGAGINDILLPILKNGIYVVKLATENGTINKKIIIQ